MKTDSSLDITRMPFRLSYAYIAIYVKNSIASLQFL